MILTRYEAAEVVTYIPEYMGNRDLEHPMEIDIVPAQAGDIRRVEEQHSMPGRATSANLIAFHNAVSLSLVRDYVRDVRKLFLRDPGTGKKREVTVEEFADVVPGDLLLEVHGAIRNHSRLEEGAKKP